jgi:DivIVA domain-containing protein
VAFDRSSIQRSDFPTARRGYEPGAVDEHLRTVADEVERIRRAGGGPMASTASSQVQRILEAAESTAEQLRTEAGDEAREHVHRVSTAARELLERIAAMHDELGELMDRLREDAGRLSSELRSLERDVGEVGAVAVDEPAPAGEPAPAAAEPEPEPTAGERSEDEEAARIVALDMALGGTPREETERYLSEHYALGDADRLLDDVYAHAGS